VPVTRNILTALRDLGATCDGVQESVIGVPEYPSFTRTLSWSIIDSDQRDRPMGRHEGDQRFLAQWMCAVSGDEEAVELDLADFKDDWRGKWLTTRAGGGLLAGASWDDTLSASPEYRVTAGAEARFYPFVVTVRFSEALP
jgi:hypothetical protein